MDQFFVCLPLAPLNGEDHMTTNTTEGAPLSTTHAAVSTAPYRAIKKAVIYLKETELDQAKAADDEQRTEQHRDKEAWFRESFGLAGRTRCLGGEGC